MKRLVICLMIALLAGCAAEGVAESGPMTIQQAVEAAAAQNPGVQAGPDRGGFLGVTYQMVSTGNPPMPAAVVTELVPGGPAQRAGLRAGDIILAVAGQGLDQVDLAGAVRARSPGQRLNLTILRVGRQQELTVTLGSRAAGAAPPAAAPPQALSPPPSPPAMAPPQGRPSPAPAPSPSGYDQGIHTVPPASGR